jgi:hypothetical protein
MATAHSPRAVGRLSFGVPDEAHTGIPELIGPFHRGQCSFTHRQIEHVHGLADLARQKKGEDQLYEQAPSAEAEKMGRFDGSIPRRSMACDRYHWLVLAPQNTVFKPLF